MRTTTYITLIILSLVVISCHKQTSITSENNFVDSSDSVSVQPCAVAMSFMQFYITRVDSFQVIFSIVKSHNKNKALAVSDSIRASEFFNDYFSEKYFLQFQSNLLNMSSGSFKLDPFLLINIPKDLKYTDLECLDGGADPNDGSHILNVFLKGSEAPILIQVILEGGQFKINEIYEWP